MPASSSSDGVGVGGEAAAESEQVVLERLASSTPAKPGLVRPLRESARPGPGKVLNLTAVPAPDDATAAQYYPAIRSEEHTSELQSL